MINFREPSTKRGIVWLITGAIVLMQALSGKTANPDALLSSVEFWLGIGVTIAGALGLLPDVPKEKAHALDRLPAITGSAGQLRDEELPSGAQPGCRETATTQAGWNDR